MTAIINSAIPRSAFELVRDQIGGILLAEFTAQKVAFGLPANCTPTKVDIERFVPVDEKEFPLCVVRTASGKYLDEDGKQTKDSGGNREGINIYYVDFYTGSPTVGETGGDKISSVTLQRMMGVAMSILEDTRYFTLGFNNKTGPVRIWNTHVRDFFINPPLLKEDNLVDYICGRVIFSVTATESVPTLPARELLEISTEVVLVGTVNGGLTWILKKQIVTVMATGTTFVDAFFSNPIRVLELLDENNAVVAVYAKGVYFSLDTGTTTITSLNPSEFSFTINQKYIAAT